MDIVVQFSDPAVTETEGFVRHTGRKIQQQILELPRDRETLLAIADLLETSMRQDLREAGIIRGSQPVSNLRLWVMENS